MESVIVRGLIETKRLAEKFAKLLKGGDIVLLNGDLGAGKTTFTKYVLQSLGVKDEVTSPTFTIMHEYDGKKHKIYHFDMYRIGSGEEAIEFGLEEYIYSKENLVFIEWSENIADILQGKFINVNISLIDENTRKFEFER